MHDKRRFVLCALLISLAATLASAQVYTIKDLGPLSPTAINKWGQVVGNFNGQAFIWTRSAGRKRLGILPGGTFSAAAINDLGVVAGTGNGSGTVGSGSSDRGSQCTDLTQPFLWTRTGHEWSGRPLLHRPDQGPCADADVLQTRQHSWPGSWRHWSGAHLSVPFLWTYNSWTLLAHGGNA